MKEYVSINMLAYNHEKWIAKAIEGVVNQKTKYKFKLYIHDDFSIILQKLLKNMLISIQIL